MILLLFTLRCSAVLAIRQLLSILNFSSKIIICNLLQNIGLHHFILRIFFLFNFLSSVNFYCHRSEKWNIIIWRKNDVLQKNVTQAIIWWMWDIYYTILKFPTTCWSLCHGNTKDKWDVVNKASAQLTNFTSHSKVALLTQTSEPIRIGERDTVTPIHAWIGVAINPYRFCWKKRRES